MKDRTQLVRVFAQDDIEAATDFRRLNFTAMALAHRSHAIGKENSAFEKIEFSKKLQAAQREKTLWQIGQTKIEPPKTSLLRDVMDREHRREWQMMSANISRHERGRPVVQVKDLRARR